MYSRLDTVKAPAHFPAAAHAPSARYRSRAYRCMPRIRLAVTFKCGHASLSRSTDVFLVPTFATLLFVDIRTAHGAPSHFLAGMLQIPDSGGRRWTGAVSSDADKRSCQRWLARGTRCKLEYAHASVHLKKGGECIRVQCNREDEVRFYCEAYATWIDPLSMLHTYGCSVRNT
jgi:hypothetical protein